LEPAIAGRFTAVWIGGPEYSGAPAFPGADREYNLNIDVPAAQVVFNDSNIDLWQVPRNAYRLCLVSMAELAARVAPAGRIGSHLYDALVAVSEREARTGRNVGETYILGDSPLVLLTALQSSFEPDTTSSRFEILPCPRLTPGGVRAEAGRPSDPCLHMARRSAHGRGPLREARSARRCEAAVDVAARRGTALRPLVGHAASTEAMRRITEARRPRRGTAE
jgi:hypothetical protein